MYSATQGVGPAVAVLLACLLMRSVKAESTLSVARPSVPVFSRHHRPCSVLSFDTSDITPPVRHVRSAMCMWVRDRTRDGSNCVYVCTTFKFRHRTSAIRGPFSTVGGRRVQIKLTHYVCEDPHVIVGPSRDPVNMCNPNSGFTGSSSQESERRYYGAFGLLLFDWLGDYPERTYERTVVSAVFVVMKNLK